MLGRGAVLDPGDPDARDAVPGRANTKRVGPRRRLAGGPVEAVARRRDDLSATQNAEHSVRARSLKMSPIEFLSACQTFGKASAIVACRTRQRDGEARYRRSAWPMGRHRRAAWSRDGRPREAVARAADTTGLATSASAGARLVPLNTVDCLSHATASDRSKACQTRYCADMHSIQHYQIVMRPKAARNRRRAISVAYFGLAPVCHDEITNEWTPAMNTAPSQVVAHSTVTSRPVAGTAAVLAARRQHACPRAVGATVPSHSRSGPTRRRSRRRWDGRR